MFKKVTVLLLAVALLIPTLSALANPNNPQIFGPQGIDETTRGTIIITRVAGDVGPLPIQAPRYVVAGVPIRVTLVTPDPTNPTNVAGATAVTGADAYSRIVITDTDGEAEFNNLPLGVWLVEELAYVYVDGPLIGTDLLETATRERIDNPIHADEFFSDFLVGLPRWVDAEGDADGNWEFTVRAYPKSAIPEYEGNYKDLVEITGNVATWEVGHAIPNAVGSLIHFSVVDIMDSGLTFAGYETVHGRFTRLGDDSDSWEDGTGELIRDTHFTVTPTGQRVDIYINEAGRTLLAEQGLLGEDGRVMFRYSASVTAPGVHGNRANWFLQEPPTTPPCDPEEEDCDLYDFCFLYPDHEYCEDVPPFCETYPELCETATFYNLEVLKINTADQNLQGAQFRMYRELTVAELELPAAERPAGTINNGTAYVVPLRTPANALIEGTTGTNGVTNFNGVPMSSEHHALWLRETVAPTGYRYINPWMPVVVATSHARPGVGDAPTFIVDVTVLNEPYSGWNLPDTGGMGTVVLTVAGLALVGGALVLFLGGKKDEETV